MKRTIDNVTVIIPAHNRPERLRRLLDYYAGTGIRIIVPDSSNDRYTGPTDEATTIYIHRPKLHFLLKINEILPMIETPYVLYCADDDFAVPEAIAQITDFLDHNPDYSIAQGHYLTFVPTEKKITFRPRYIRRFDSRITSETSPARLKEKTEGIYAPLLYGVARTDAFRTIYSYCFDNNGKLRFKNLFLAEEFFNNAMLIMGKYATLPCFFSARELIPGSATSTTVPIPVMKSTPEYRPEYEGYLTALTLLLADRSDLTESEARAAITALESTPPDKSSVLFKRRVNAWLDRYAVLAPLAALSRWRYNQKGLKAVRGMESYPCTFTTPERQAIEDAIHKSGA